MIDLCNKLIDNELTREELLERVEIRKTCQNDLMQICETLAKAFNLESYAEALWQLENSKVCLNDSIKLVDKETNEIYGLLIFTEYPIMMGSPIQMVESGLCEYLSGYEQINGHSFIIDERLRNSGLDKKMLYFNIDFLTENCDFIWIGVEKSLKSLPYWHRLGFIDIFIIEEATFLLLPLSNNFIKSIYQSNG